MIYKGIVIGVLALALAHVTSCAQDLLLDECIYCIIYIQYILHRMYTQKINTLLYIQYMLHRMYTYKINTLSKPNCAHNPKSNPLNHVAC